MIIRPVALAIIRNNEGHLLVQELNFPGNPTTFYRPIGGTMEPGENSKQTLIRELKEELDQEIEEPNLVAVIENIFGTEEDMGHENVFMYEARFKDAAVYLEEELAGLEGTEPYRAMWKPIDWFVETDEDVKLIPDGLLNYLLNNGDESQQTITHIKTR